MTLVEEMEFVQQMLNDFKLSLVSVRKEPLFDYEIELISERYKITKNDLKRILTKVYNKEIKNLRAKKRTINGSNNER